MVRLACLVNLAKLGLEEDNDLFTTLLKDDAAEIQALLLNNAFFVGWTE